MIESEENNDVDNIAENDGQGEEYNFEENMPEVNNAKDVSLDSFEYDGENIVSEVGVLSFTEKTYSYPVVH